jgi:hypothetical protein
MTNPVHALVILAALAGASGASEPPAAVQHFVAGKQLYDAHLFRRALAEFEAGFVASELPGFLLNMAQCHRRLGDLDEALRDYQSYLERDATSGTAREVREIVDELAPRAREEPPPPPPPPSLTLVAAPPPPPEPRATRPFTWAGVSLGGTLLVSGAALEIAASQTFNQLRATCGASVGGCSPAERASFEREYSAATGLFVSAAIASVATIAAALLEERARRARAGAR